MEDKAIIRKVGDLRLDRLQRTATRGDKTIELTPHEFLLLDYLMRYAGVAVTREQILKDAWGGPVCPSSNVVDVYVGYLRDKLGRGEFPLIHTVSGVGYRIGVASALPTARELNEQGFDLPRNATIAAVVREQS